MDMLGTKESLDRMAPASSMQWYGHVLRKEDENVIVKALKFEVSGSIGRGRPKQTWKKQVEDEMKKNGPVKEDASDRAKWRDVAKTIPYENRPTPSTRTIPDPTCDDDRITLLSEKELAKIRLVGQAGILLALL